MFVAKVPLDTDSNVTLANQNSIPLSHDYINVLGSQKICKTIEDNTSTAVIPDLAENESDLSDIDSSAVSEEDDLSDETPFKCLSKSSIIKVISGKS